jgi:L-amino acid N-acyltransferase YncA
MQQEDAAAVLEIYAQGIEDRVATFELTCPSWEGWDKNHAKSCRPVAESEGKIIAWAAPSPVSRQASYHGGAIK